MIKHFWAGLFVSISYSFLSFAISEEPNIAGFSAILLAFIVSGIFLKEEEKNDKR